MPILRHTAHMTSVADLAPLLDVLSGQLAWPPKARFQIELALEELVVNTFNHGKSADSLLPSDAIGIDVLIKQDGSDLSITLKDNAIAFDPTDFPEPDVTLSAEDRKIGGLGLFFASKMMDTISYERLDGVNQITLYKHLS